MHDNCVVNWQPPDDDGGTEITGYIVEVNNNLCKDGDEDQYDDVVKWKPPDDDGGTEITGYIVEVTNDDE